MKRIIAISVAAGLMLAGCNTVNPNIIVTNTTSVLNDVAAATVTACGFVPAVITIEQILNASSEVMTATQIASIICKSVTKKAFVWRADGGISTIEINGKVIVIHGNFVASKHR